MAETVEKDAKQSIARNKRARHDYHILDTWEAGVVLTGSEVKSLRDGKANIADSYAIVQDGEVFLLNLHISPYEKASSSTTSRHDAQALLHARIPKARRGRASGCLIRGLYFKRARQVALALGKGAALRQARRRNAATTSATAAAVAQEIALLWSFSCSTHFRRCRDGARCLCTLRSTAASSVRATR